MCCFLYIVHVGTMIPTLQIIYAIAIALILFKKNNDDYADACLHSGGDYVIDIAIYSAVKFVIKLLLVMVLFVMFLLLQLIDSQTQ